MHSRAKQWISILILLFFHYGAWSQGFNPLSGRDTLVLERERLEDLPTIERYLPSPLPFQLTHGQNYFDYTPPASEYVPLIPSFAPRQELPPKPKWKKLYSRYVEGGFGRFLTNEFAIGIGNGRHRRHHYFFQYHERSTPKGHLPYAQFGTHRVQALYEGMLDRQVLYSYVDGFYQKRFYYGRLFPDTLPKNVILDQYQNQWFQGEMRLGFRSHYDTTGVVYDLPVTLRFFSDRFRNQEFNGKMEVRLAFPLPQEYRGELKGHVGYGYFHYAQQPVQHYYFLELAPQVWRKIEQNLEIHGGFQVNHFQLPDKKQTSLYPLFSVSYFLSANHMVFGQLEGSLTLPSRYLWSRENGYLDTLVTLQLQNERYKLRGGMKGSLGKKVDYFVGGFLREIRNAPLLFSPSADTVLNGISVEQGTFVPLYASRMRNYGGEVEIRYVLTDYLFAFAKAVYQQFWIGSEENPLIKAAYHWLPSQWNVGVHYRLQEKWGVELNWFYIGKRPVGISGNGQVIELDPFVDLSLLLHYNVSNHFYFQMVGNNLLNLSYQRWYFYQERPLDFLVKVGYNF